MTRVPRVRPPVTLLIQARREAVLLYPPGPNATLSCLPLYRDGPPKSPPSACAVDLPEEDGLPDDVVMVDRGHAVGGRAQLLRRARTAVPVDVDDALGGDRPYGPAPITTTVVDMNSPQVAARWATVNVVSQAIRARTRQPPPGRPRPFRQRWAIRGEGASAYDTVGERRFARRGAGRATSDGCRQ